MNEIIKAASVERQAVDEGELALINAQAMVPRTAEDVFVFRLRACDNQVDRDLERFTERTLDQLAELFVGKPVLRDHNWSANSQTARVYAAGTEAVDGVKSLVLRGYMPRTSRTASTITDIESGILRECSVGVSVRQTLCAVCGEEYGKCSHMRGREYDGKTCHVDLDDAVDAYEVSFLPVPAQPGSGVVKRYEVKEKALEGKGKPPADAGKDSPELRMAQAMQEQEENRYGGM